jgi:hypothetical protein
MTTSQPPQPPVGGQPPAGSQPPGAARAGTSFDPSRLRLADYAIAGLTLLFLVLSFFTWYDLGLGDFFGAALDDTVSGWTDGQVKFAFFLFLLAAVWAALPAFADVPVAFPRSFVTVGLAAVGFVLTLLVWIDTLDFEFSVFALLGLLTAAAILAFAVLTLLPELRTRSALPGAVAGAAQWANRPASGGLQGGAVPPQGSVPPPPPA